jgi:hypothetical protein
MPVRTEPADALAAVTAPRPARANGPRVFVTGVSTATAAAVPALAAGAGPLPLAAVIAVEQLLLGWAWVRACAGSTGTLVIVILAGPAADVTALVTASHEIGGSVGVIGVALVAVILGQLARRRMGVDPAGPDQASTAAGAADTDGRGAGGHPPERPARVTVDMAAGLSGVVVVTLLAGYVDAASIGTPAGRLAGPAVVVAGLLGAGLAVLVTRVCAAMSGSRVVVLSGWPVLSRIAGSAAGGAAGAVVGAVSGGLAVATGAAIAAVAAVVAIIMDMVVARGAAERRAAGGPAFEWPLAAVLPLAAAATFIYAIGHALVG